LLHCSVLLITLDRSVESEFCFDVIMLGKQQARVKHNLLSTKLMSNGKYVSNFLKLFMNKKVIREQNVVSDIF